MRNIFIWHYELFSKRSLNASSSRLIHPGVLVRRDEGFGCIHPWPELGDLPLEKELASLAQGNPGPLGTMAMACAKSDGSARKMNRSLFVGPVPESHWLAMPEDDPCEALSQGFRTVKFKVGPEFHDQIVRARAWAKAGFSLRFDANASLTPTSAIDFWKALGALQRWVELIEDPIPWESQAWACLRKAGMPLAVDRKAETRFSEGDIAVIKPALSSWIPTRPSSFLVTSAMDHALGQMWAAAEASRHASGPENQRLLACGLATHRCFEKDAFFEQIVCAKARIIAPPEAGLGFTELLENLPWKRLS